MNNENKYKILSKGTDYNSPTSEFLCLNCGHKFFASLHNANRKNIKLCPYCEITKKDATKEQAEYKLKMSGEDYTIISFNGMTKKSIVRHNVCGHIIDNTNISRIIARHTKHCLYCSHGSIAYTTEYVRKEINQLTNGEYTMLGEYKSEDIPFLIRHEKCGCEWMVRRRNFVYKETRCPECSKRENISKIENFIKDYLVKNYSDIFQEKEDEEVTYNNCKNIRMLPFDFRIKKFNLLIEFDGEQHFHKMRVKKEAEKKLLKVHKNDLIKNKFCIDNNINLLRINYKQNKDNIKIILDEILQDGKISSTTIEKFSLYYNGENSEKYYSLYKGNEVE